MKHFFNTPAFLAAEALLLLGGLPALIALIRDRGLMIGLLWAGAACKIQPAPAQDVPGTGWRAGLRPIFLRFLVLAPLIFAGAWLFMPDEFLSFPRQAPDRWLMVMLLYPLLSVWPQEIIYRAYIHRRYAPLWRTEGGYIAASALTFGYMHIIFLNAPAVIMTALLGALLARDYAKHRSLTLVCAEHALYGCLIFTSGLGRFFHSGAAWI